MKRIKELSASMGSNCVKVNHRPGSCREDEARRSFLTLRTHVCALAGVRLKDFATDPVLEERRSLLHSRFLPSSCPKCLHRQRPEFIPKWQRNIPGVKYDTRTEPLAELITQSL